MKPVKVMRCLMRQPVHRGVRARLHDLDQVSTAVAEPYNTVLCVFSPLERGDTMCCGDVLLKDVTAVVAAIKTKRTFQFVDYRGGPPPWWAVSTTKRDPRR
jgi:hypothetical protein